jgi:hypothetical protein
MCLKSVRPELVEGNERSKKAAGKTNRLIIFYF